MNKRTPTSPAGQKLPKPRAGSGIEVTEGFRSARSALDQTATHLQQLRRHAASLVKGTGRPAK
jgi:hypothetical protein